MVTKFLFIHYLKPRDYVDHETLSYKPNLIPVVELAH